MAALPAVTIDIKEDTDGSAEKLPYTYGSTNQVRLEREEDPQGSGFVKLVHTSATGPSGGLFTVEKVQSGNYGRDITEIKPTNNEPIYYYSIWYYSGDRHHNQPLLIEIGEKGGTFKYHETKGSGFWTVLNNGSQHNQLTGRELEQKLDYLNCKYNKAVTIDLTSGKHQPGHSYCCGDKHDTGKKGSQLREIKLELPPKRFHISSTKLVVNLNLQVLSTMMFPIKGPASVYAFYCTGNGPVLIYVENNGIPPVNTWFKKSDSGDDTWQKVPGISKDPENIKDCSEKNFEQLVNALNKFPGCGYETCVGPAKSVPSSPLGLGAASGRGSPGVGTATSGSPNPDSSNSTSGTSATTTTASTAQSGQTAATGLGVIFGSTSGTLAGAGGLTGLGWWAFKRSKGDPWVRQI